MKKFLVNILLTLFLVFAPLATNSQDVNDGYTFKFTPQTEYNWKVSGDAFCGVGEVWCGMFRSKYKNSLGYYEYSLWFQSNSYFTNCNWSRTYMEDIDVYYYNPTYRKWYKPKNYQSMSWTVGAQTLYYTFYDIQPDVQFKVQIDKMEPTIY